MKFGDPRLLVFVVAIALAAAVAWPPLSQLLSPVQGSYNEGWNAYRQFATTLGVPLYGTPPGYFVTNYTPLSFHLIGALGHIGTDFVLLGRLVSLASLVVVSAACGGIAYLVGRCVWAAVFACLLFWISLAVFDPLQLGVDDPQLLGMALLVLGLLLYLRMGALMGSVIAPAVLFSLAVMTKQSFLPVPVCIGLHLVLCRRFRDAAWYSATAVLCTGAMAGLFYWLDGPYLLGNWFFARATSWDAAVAKTTPFATQFQIGFIAAAALVLARVARARVVQALALALVGSAATGFVAVAGDGVNQNLYFDTLFIVCALAAGQVGRLDANTRAGFGAVGLAALLLLPALITAPGTAIEFRHARAEAPRVAFDHAAALALLRAAPGPAICEHMKLCFDAGKSMVYDPFFVSDQLQIGALDEGPILELLDRQCFGALQLEMWRTETVIEPTTPPAPRPRFTAAFMEHLFAHYQSAYASRSIANGLAVFVPRAGARADGPCRMLDSLPARPV